MSPAEKLRAALELHEVGVAVMRQNLRRRHPDAPPSQIEQLLSQTYISLSLIVEKDLFDLQVEQLGEPEGEWEAWVELSFLDCVDRLS